MFPLKTDEVVAMGSGIGYVGVKGEARGWAARTPGLSRLALALGALLAAPVAAQAQDGAAPREAADTELNPLVVVGSRSGYATALESAAPVQVVSGQELERTGSRTLSEALQKTVPSFNFPTSAPSANAASFVKGVGLRGLAADQTLVMVNGKRRHATAQLSTSAGAVKGAQTVDLNSIPLSAIARVEVLLDGASAQYGSDAVAGVVNIILKEQSEGGDISIGASRNDQGDGESYSAQGSFGFALPGDGFLTLSFDAWDIGRTRLSGTDTRQMYFPGDPREADHPNRNWFYGSGASERQNLFLNAESTVGAATLYAFASYGQRKDQGFGNLREPRADQTVRAIHPDGFQPWLDVESKDASATAGVRWSSAKAGNFDASATWGRNRVASVVSNTNNASLGLDSPTAFNTGDLENEQASVNLDWTHSYEVGFLPSTLYAAAGATYRHESYEVFEGDYGSWANGGVPILDGPNAGKVATPASQGFGGFSPDDAGRRSRDVYGVYAELETQLTDSLRVTVSGRSEDYSDFGSTSNGRLALRWEVAPGLAWRGSFSAGYRAPSLGQSVYARTIPNITNGVLATNRMAQVDSVVARALGATDLTPEESVNLSTGLVWTVDDRFAATLDVYRIDIDDRIVLSETLSGTLVRQVLADAGFPTYTGVQYFTNGADTRTRGLDATARYSLRFAGGDRLDLSAGYNWNETRITERKPTPGVIAASGQLLIGRESSALIELANPRSFARVGADYRRGDFDASLSVVRYGSYQTRHTSNAALDQVYDRQFVVNLGTGWQFNDAFKFSLGVNNLLDSHPDQVIAGLRNPVVARYSTLSPEGGAGRVYFARIDYAF
jgi:iron complex outermembrane receptor protein